VLPEAATQSLPAGRQKRPRPEALSEEPVAKLQRPSNPSATGNAERSSPAQHSQRQAKKLRPRSTKREIVAEVPGSADLCRRAPAAGNEPAAAARTVVPGSTGKLQDGDQPGWICGLRCGVTQVGVQTRPQPQLPDHELAGGRQVARPPGPRPQAQPVRPEVGAQAAGGHPQRRRTSAPAPALATVIGAPRQVVKAAPRKLDATGNPSNNRLSSGTAANASASLPDGTPVRTRPSPESLARAERSSGMADRGRPSASECAAADTTPRRSPRAVGGSPAGPAQRSGTPAKAPMSADMPAVAVTPRRSPRQRTTKRSPGSAGGAVSPIAAAAEAAARLANADWFNPLDPGKVQRC